MAVEADDDVDHMLAGFDLLWMLCYRDREQVRICSFNRPMLKFCISATESREICHPIFTYQKR